MDKSIVVAEDVDKDIRSKKINYLDIFSRFANKKSLKVLLFILVAFQNVTTTLCVAQHRFFGFS